MSSGYTVWGVIVVVGLSLYYAWKYSIVDVIREAWRELLYSRNRYARWLGNAVTGIVVVVLIINPVPWYGVVSLMLLYHFLRRRRIRVARRRKRKIECSEG